MGFPLPGVLRTSICPVTSMSNSKWRKEYVEQLKHFEYVDTQWPSIRNGSNRNLGESFV